MALVVNNKTNFNSGEISSLLLGRTDLRAYENGARLLRNVFIYASGGVKRRSGLRFVDAARGDGRLLAFEFNTEQVYLLVFTDHYMDVYRNDVRVAGLSTPWSFLQLRQINWTQSADTLLVVHPEVPPKKISRASEDRWDLADWTFVEKDSRSFQPHYKFADSNITLKPSAGSGAISVSASASVFHPGHVGTRIRLQDREIEVSRVHSPVSIDADCKEPLVSLAETPDWTEQSFSDVRGFPASVCFHQDRLVIGGSRDLPHLLWISKSADLFNFDLGDGLDDDAIEFPILSDQVNAIRHIFSGRHLQVFTSGAEWMVGGEPLTPTSIQVHRQTRIGSPVDRTIPPRDVDGATMFVPRDGPQLREFLYTDTEQAYQASDLAMLAHHLVSDPLDMDFEKASRLLYVVMSNGTLGTLTVFRDEQISAWTLQKTAGAFRSVAAVGEKTYALVERASGVFVEVFDDRIYVDAGLAGVATTPTTKWSGLDHLEGMTVKVVADGSVRGDRVVEGGAITLEEPASAVEAGLGYTHVIEPLPPSFESVGSGSGARMRPVSITFRLWETGALRLDIGKGLRDISFKRMGQELFDIPRVLYCGDKTIRSTGWRSSNFQPIWRIEQDIPLPFTLLAVSSVMSINR